MFVRHMSKEKITQTCKILVPKSGDEIVISNLHYYTNIKQVYPLTRAKHCVKSVQIRSYSGPYFPTFGLNTERYSLSLRIQSKCGKTRSRITPNMNSFYAVKITQSKMVEKNAFD